MSKLSLLVIRQERETLSDGRIIEKAIIDLKDRSTYHWQCVCRPEDKHDHNKLIETIASGLANREQVLPDIAKLVGYQVLVGNTQATVTDANIQIRGPLNFDTYIAWKYDDGRMEEKVYPADDPLKSPHPDTILADIKTAVTLTETRSVAAKAVAAFTGDISNEDPTVPA